MKKRRALEQLFTRDCATTLHGLLLYVNAYPHLHACNTSSNSNVNEEKQTSTTKLFIQIFCEELKNPRKTKPFIFFRKSFCDLFFSSSKIKIKIKKP
jgi:hypothetical protein